MFYHPMHSYNMSSYPYPSGPPWIPDNYHDPLDPFVNPLMPASAGAAHFSYPYSSASGPYPLTPSPIAGDSPVDTLQPPTVQGHYTLPTGSGYRYPLAFMPGSGTPPGYHHIIPLPTGSGVSLSAPRRDYPTPPPEGGQGQVTPRGLAKRRPPRPPRGNRPVEAECLFCGQVFRYKRNLGDHPCFTGPGPRHYCDFPGCDKSYAHKRTLTKHKRKWHPSLSA